MLLSKPFAREKLPFYALRDEEFVAIVLSGLRIELKCLSALNSKLTQSFSASPMDR